MDYKKLLDNLIKTIIEEGGSDIHLTVGYSPAIRVHGDLFFLKKIDPLTEENVLGLVSELLNVEYREKFLEEKEIDFSYGSNDARFRGNCFFSKGTVGVSLRLISKKIKTLSELNLPPILETFTRKEQGFFLVVGPVGNGKTTTLAAMIDLINQEDPKHIMTVEDPIEFLHKDKKSIVNQREVHIDTSSYSIALHHAMRQDPDVILIGEMRDIESFHIALGASETGHTVFTTLHSTDTSGVFSRILDFFPPSQHHQIRMQLSLNLKAVICQRLIPRMDQDGVTPAVEILINTPTVSRLIRENRLNKIISAIQGGLEDGMQTFNMSLVELCKEGFISREQAMANATNPEELKMNLQGIFLDESKQILGD